MNNHWISPSFCDCLYLHKIDRVEESLQWAWKLAEFFRSTFYRSLSNAHAVFCIEILVVYASTGWSVSWRRSRNLHRRRFANWPSSNERCRACSNLVGVWFVFVVSRIINQSDMLYSDRRQRKTQRASRRLCEGGRGCGGRVFLERSLTRDRRLRKVRRRYDLLDRFGVRNRHRRAPQVRFCKYHFGAFFKKFSFNSI